MTINHSFDLNSIRKININGKIIECEIECEKCQYLKLCKKISTEDFKYKLFSKTFGSYLIKNNVIFPIIKEDPKTTELMYKMLLKIYISTNFNEKINSYILSKFLEISVYSVRQLIEKMSKYMDISKNTFVYSFNKECGLFVKLYIAEFNKRFSHPPLVSAADANLFIPLVKDYSPLLLEKIIQAFFNSTDPFVINSGFSLKSLYYRFNYYLIKANSEVSLKVSPERINEYLEGKRNGKWTGTEEWARPYEEALKKML